MCQDSSSVILKSKCKLEKYNLQSWFIYTQLKSLTFMFINFLNLFLDLLDFPIFPPKEQWVNKLKTHVWGNLFHSSKCLYWENFNLKNIFTCPLKMISSHMYLIYKKWLLMLCSSSNSNNNDNNNNNNGFLPKIHFKWYFFLENIDFCSVSIVCDFIYLLK